MSNPIRVGVLQTAPQATMAQALDHARALAETALADGATFLALPEYCGGLATADGKLAPPHADENAHEFLKGMKALAVERGVWIMVGSVAITGPEGRIYNRGFLLDEAGAVRARYDKIHLFDVNVSAKETYRESDVIAPGGQASLADTPLGKLGHTICYDLRFADLYRRLALAGAEVLAVPAAFLQTTGQAHWHVLNRARAIENGAFVIAPGAVGAVPGGGQLYGHSLVVDPWGQVLGDAGDTPGALVVEVDRDAVAKARARVPSLTHGRDFTLETVEARDAD